MDDGETVVSPRVASAVAPLIALRYHFKYTYDPQGAKSLPNGEAWVASLETVSEEIRHLSLHKGHVLDIGNGHDHLVDTSSAKEMTFTGTREELRERLAALEAGGATGIIFGTSGYDVKRELHAYAEVAGLS
jgi:5,10-methylenetetrahydromethanopterin reductase